MDRKDELAYMVGAMVADKTIWGDETPDLDIRLHVDSADDWWINTGLADYDSVHGKWIAADTITPESDPDEVAQSLWDQIETIVAQYQDGARSEAVRGMKEWYDQNMSD